MLDFVWNLRQQKEIAGAQSAVAQTKNDLGRANDHIRGLERSLEETTAVVQALWELLRERLELTDAELLTKISALKTREAATVHQPAPAVALNCASCARPISPKAPRCLYCGTPTTKSQVF